MDQNFWFEISKYRLGGSELGSRTHEMRLEQILQLFRYAFPKEFLKSSKIEPLNRLPYRASPKVRPPALSSSRRGLLRCDVIVAWAACLCNETIYNLLVEEGADPNHQVVENSLSFIFEVFPDSAGG